MRRPSFQFYPADWRKDVELRSCSIAARGLWIDLLCIAHECEPYGHLTINGRPMTANQLAGQVGLVPAVCKKLLDELIANGVARRNADGAVYSKRMVDDEGVRELKAEVGRQNGLKGAAFGALGAQHGKKGGRPRAENPGSEPSNKPADKPPQNPPPSSSSSSSSSEDPLTPKGDSTVHRFPPGFDRFWEAYPKKVGKDDAAKAFAKRKPTPELLESMLAAIAVQRRSEQWLKDGGQFIPNPSTWLNQGRWLDEVASHGVQAPLPDFLRERGL